MAASDNHTRSYSLPTKPHPLILQCNEHLSRFEASIAITSSSSSSSFSHKLRDLQDLHETVEKLAQLSLTKEVLVQESQENWVEKLLDGSLRLLDACTAAKDSLLHTKECAREVQSIMRRKRGGEVEVTIEVRKYLTSRKVVKKAISKALGNLKSASNKCKLSPSHKGHHQNPELVSLFKDVEIVTLQILESLLSFISASTQSKASNWSLVSKLIQNRRISCPQEGDKNEFAKVDSALQAFVFHTTSKSENTEDLQNRLKNLELVIQDFVERLETLLGGLSKLELPSLTLLITSCANFSCKAL